MKNVIFFDEPEVRLNLLPLSFTRPLADFRIGITTIREKWASVIDGHFSYLTVDYLRPKFPCELTDDNLFIAGHVCPSKEADFVDALNSLERGDALFSGDTLIAFRGTEEDFLSHRHVREIHTDYEFVIIRNLYDIFGYNARMITDDFAHLPHDSSVALSETNRIIGPTHSSDGTPLIYVSPSARVEGAFINTTAGPVYIGDEAEVMEGSCLRGPVAICRHAVVNMGTKIYPATTIGPWCKVGGELNNVVMFAYSNKAHDGFLGNAVIGEWCNLGAGCVASNLKNDYTPIRLWNYPAHRFLRTGLQFCGLIMGDHSKAGINTMFNTATVVGVGVNVHGSGFPRNFIPSFSEGGAAGFSDVSLTKFFDIAARVMARRHCELTDTDRSIFEEIYAIADSYK